VRLFAAIDLDEGARRVAANSARLLAASLDRSDAGVRVRWVAAEKLHVTLRFLGSVTDPQVELVRRTLHDPWSTPAFTARLGDVRLFPGSGPPHVVWLDVDEGLTQMSTLKTELEERLAPIGFEPETRPFRAHLTLGRVKRRIGGAAAAPLRALLLEHRSEPVRWMVNRVTLYESRMSERGGTYHVVDQVTLLSSGPQERMPR